MNTKFYIALILFIGIACKKEHRPAHEVNAAMHGILMDTFTLLPIPNCRVFLLDFASGREQIIGEEITNDHGAFSFDSISSGNQIQFAHNNYAWHLPQNIKQGHYFVSPYVLVNVKIDASPGFLIKELKGNFNDSPIANIETKLYSSPPPAS